ncbi:MAG: phytanoyl-CoA dioxygenase family protein [Bacteroidetes bacterium]|nr:phytanoyl-CoA dioxygenase family protein [Bacteroidota bacterium]
MHLVAPIFIDADLQRQFDSDGYVKIRILDEAKTQLLLDFFMAYQQQHAVIRSLYQSTTHTNDPALIRLVDTKIKSILQPELDRFFRDYLPMMCTYITKQSGEGSETRIHQDPSFVDESKYVTANVWVALHDIDHRNGNLFFVKGSHRMVPSLRVTPGCPTSYDLVQDLLPDYITEVPVRAGEAIIINHAVIHGATANLSNHPRIAAVMAIRSAASELLYYYMEPDAPRDKIEKYAFDLDTFFHLKKDGRPDESMFQEYIRWDFPQISREDFISFMNTFGKPAKAQSWFEKFFLS